MPEISFVNQNRKITVEQGANLREAAIKEYVSLYPHIFKILNCRGHALCGTCVVEIVSGQIDPPNDSEKKKLKKKLAKNPKLRLACQLTIKNDLEVRTHV
ncbi:MAG: 2Fe-2S iron-sulfur cluster-binding protein [Nitrospinales bacterium]